MSLPPAQGEERHECDIPGNALDQERLGGAVREAVGVLHTDDVGDLDRPVQVGEADVADPHTGNQALVASRGQRAKLIDESRVWDGVFGKPQASETEPCSNVTDCISSSSVLFGEVDRSNVRSGVLLKDSWKKLNANSICAKRGPAWFLM